HHPAPITTGIASSHGQREGLDCIRELLEIDNTPRCDHAIARWFHRLLHASGLLHAHRRSAAAAMRSKARLLNRVNRC
ncbi:hypothetical protein, partial [Salmonella enterica]|uniref:hypothetical protein n=1 Tax=Salmonella enterica TaxID=28901 RepID=UPI003EDC842A